MMVTSIVVISVFSVGGDLACHVGSVVVSVSTAGSTVSAVRTSWVGTSVDSSLRLASAGHTVGTVATTSTS